MRANDLNVGKNVNRKRKQSGMFINICTDKKMIRNIDQKGDCIRFRSVDYYHIVINI